jgi:hypothetical protein
MQEIFRKSVKYYKVGRIKYKSKESIRKTGNRIYIRKLFKEEYKLDPKYNSFLESNI